MFRAVEKPIPAIYIAARKSSPYEGYQDRGLPIRIAAKEKEIRDQMAADDKEARANRLSARNAKKEELEAKEQK
jgi:hypothetical protein